MAKQQKAPRLKSADDIAENRALLKSFSRAVMDWNLSELDDVALSARMLMVQQASEALDKPADVAMLPDGGFATRCIQVPGTPIIIEQRVEFTVREWPWPKVARPTRKRATRKPGARRNALPLPAGVGQHVAPQTTPRAQERELRPA